MTIADFIESTIAGALGTHNPYHWMVLGVQWVGLHILAVWAIIRNTSWLAIIVSWVGGIFARIWNVVWSFFWGIVMNLWK